MNIIRHTLSFFRSDGTATAVLRDAETHAHVAEIDVTYRSRLHAGFGIKVDGDNAYGRDVSFDAGIFWHVYGSVGGDAARSLARRVVGRDARSLAFSVFRDRDGFDGVVAHWRLWVNPDRGGEGTPRWRDGGAGLWHELLGPTTCEETIVTSEQATIVMPEAHYPATVEVIECVWSRPRWPGAWHRRTSARVTVEDGVPIPSTGGDDAMHCLTFVGCGTVSEAVMAFQQAVSHERHAYGRGSAGR